MISPFLLVRFMPPDDPLGKNGPTLDQFLRKKVKLPSPLPQPCPYGKKCTYGNKCKFYHPDRATNQKSITDKLKEHSSQRINEVRARVNSRDSSPGNVVLAFYTKGQVPWENIYWIEKMLLGVALGPIVVQRSENRHLCSRRHDVASAMSAS